MSSGTFASGRVSTAVAFTGPDSAFDAYFVVFGSDASGNNAIYISDLGTVNYQPIGESDVTFGSQNDFSSAGFKDLKAGYGGAGWYAASVPEPTSGLLMLLGMAGLALRRRRA